MSKMKVTLILESFYVAENSWPIVFEAGLLVGQFRSHAEDMIRRKDVVCILLV
jgi:hypothetical protein